MSQAMKELMSLVSNNKEISLTARTKLLEALDIWRYEWVDVIEAKTLVTDTKYLDSEYRDILLYNLGENLSETIIEDCAEITINKKNIEAKGLIIRKKRRA
jgi:hypothetical protein